MNFKKEKEYRDEYQFSIKLEKKKRFVCCQIVSWTLPGWTRIIYIFGLKTGLGHPGGCPCSSPPPTQGHTSSAAAVTLSRWQMFTKAEGAQTVQARQALAQGRLHRLQPVLAPRQPPRAGRWQPVPSWRRVLALCPGLQEPLRAR